MDTTWCLFLIVGLHFPVKSFAIGPKTRLYAPGNYCDVVEATVAMLGSMLSSSGLRDHISPAMFEANGFLRVLAYVETRDGQNFISGQGGLWHVEHDQFGSGSCQFKLQTNYGSTTFFQFDYFSVSFNDWDTPIHSAVGALLTLLCKGANLTDLTDLPGLFFTYQSRSMDENAAREFFTTGKESYERNPCHSIACSNASAADVIVLMDSSGSIGRSDFTIALNYTAELSLLYPLGENMTRFGAIFYNHDPLHSLSIPLNYSYDHSELVSKIKSTGYAAGGTQTGRAITFASEQFFNVSFGSRNSDPNESISIPLVLIVATDGQSSDDVTEPSQSARDNMDINMFSIGIGPNVNEQELKDIAGEEDRVFRTPSYSDLAHIALLIQSATCKAQISVKEGKPITLTLSSSEVRYFKIKLGFSNCSSHESLSLTFNSTNGNTTVYGSFSYTNPTSTLHDFKLIVNRDGTSSRYVFDTDNTGSDGNPLNCSESSRKRRQTSQETDVRTLYLGMTVDSEDTTVEISATVAEVPEEARLSVNVQSQPSYSGIISFTCSVTCNCPSASITWIRNSLITILPSSASVLHSANNTVVNLLLDTTQLGYEGEYVCIIESPLVIGSVRSVPVRVPLNCENNGTNDGLYRCTCPPGRTGRVCNQFKCEPKCQNNGSCIGPNECSCTYGWGGNDCSQPVCDPACLHGVCASPYNCNCSSGWTGTACDIPVCQPRCVHGVCTTQHVCKCDLGWRGRNCSEYFCDPLCVNGLCVGPNNCSCSDGWRGQTCSDPDCQPACKNGGKCVSSFHCHCLTGWFGKSCEIAYCPDPCNNGGTCVSPGQCTCTVKWTGGNCTTPVCTEKCQNGGTCAQPDHCRCPDGWSGPTCERNELKQESSAATVVPAVIVPLFVVVLIALAIVGVIFIVRWKSKRTASYERNAAQPEVTSRTKPKKKMSGGVMYSDIAAVTISPSTENLFDPVPEEDEPEGERDIGSGEV